MLISLDFETYSDVDIRTAGLYKYFDSPAYEPLLLSWAVNDEPVQIVDFANREPLPKELVDLLGYSDADIYFCAFNAAFERTALAKLGYPIAPEYWFDTQILASYCGLPRNLKDVGKALKLPQEQQKMKEGADLIRYFCVPCKPTKTNGQRTRNLPEHDPVKWATFRAYNRQDVETERVIRKRLEAYGPPLREWDLWHMDQHINDRGVMIDRELVSSAVAMAEAENKRLMAEAIEITGLSNPNSVSQLKAWLKLEEGATLDKKAVAAMLPEAEGDRKRMLEIRMELGKSSVKKYEAMLRSACHDDRVRGTLQFYKANRTGRWSGAIIQPQNFPQNHLEDLDYARKLVRENDSDAIKLLFGSVSDTLSQLIRTAIIPRPGCQFAVCDFSAIEARVVAWLSDEKWRQKVFEEGGDIYCASASEMFKVPVVKHGINGELRAKGKVAELALGYGGSVGAMKAMGALDMGLTEEELPEIVDKWRSASPHIVRLWSKVDTLCRAAMELPGEQVKGPHGLSFIKEGAFLQIHLPSGRCLNYLRPKIAPNRFGSESITYEGNEAGKWGRCETFGGKLVENIVQSLARDCLAEAMLKVEALGHQIVFHVHDEMIVETEDAQTALQDMQRCMSEPIPWAPGLLLRGDGYICDYYRKD